MTVGYGDVVPRTPLGHVVVSMLIIMSALYMAVPLGIVGGSFSRVWEDRDRLMLIRRTRIKLLQCGYGPRDILDLFYLYDLDKSGKLNIGEFTQMIKDMELGIGTERTYHLFKTFDSDGNGKVDEEEFVRAIFPKAFHIIFQDDFAHDDQASATTTDYYGSQD
uniref:EF-hand domain-containing protein n=1 Tax=Alexandrium catenella TaxID=2925 RepID=A0A7S1M2M9_ALECA|mmetsp:Transcript_18635/g.50537  ORF Transcript_18635/g.50537 Transcript_18635/m.50537 type:complete len:163 (+) Transcript_18635:2-490(+)